MTPDRPHRYLGLCIGGQKCGTSSLHEYIMANGVPITDDKEHKAWLGNAPTIDWSTYCDLVQRSLQDAELFVEIDPDLSLFPSEVARIAALGRDAAVRILFVYRDPVERLWSQYVMNVRRGHESRPLLEALRDDGKRTAVEAIRGSYRRRSSYAGLLSQLVPHLAPSTQITLASLEALKSQPAMVCREWLPSLSATGLEAALPHSNRGRVSRVPRLSRWLNSEPTVIRAGAQFLGRGSMAARRFRHFRAWLETTGESPRMDEGVRAATEKRLADDWNAFRRLLSRDPVTLSVKTVRELL